MKRWLWKLVKRFFREEYERDLIENWLAAPMLEVVKNSQVYGHGFLKVTVKPEMKKSS